MSESNNQPTTGTFSRPEFNKRPGGAWVTLHIAIGDMEKMVLGYLIGMEAGQYKLTKYVTVHEQYESEPHYREGRVTTIHEGVWLVNPLHVWMVEHEQEAPIPGIVFAPLGG